MAEEPRWLLIDYDGTGFCEIQANDEHEDRANFDDDFAVRFCIEDAKKGSVEALRAIERHNKAAEQIAAIRRRVYGGDWQAIVIPWPALVCPSCNEIHEEDEPEETTHQQWRCMACGSWNDK